MADSGPSQGKPAETSSSGNATPSLSSTPVPRVIGNLTKMGESSRGGARMKFTPNMPARKPKQEDTPAPKVTQTANAKPLESQSTERGRGRGKGRARGRGTTATATGRGNAAPQMVPAGPFAMGPLAAGMAGMSRPAASYRSGPSGEMAVKKDGAIKAEHAPSLPRNRDQLILEEAREVYSDDEGDVIVDLEEVKNLDFMAPDALKKEKRKEPRGKSRTTVKKEPVEGGLSVEPNAEEATKNEAQALDLSESEEEIELEDLQPHFVLGEGTAPGSDHLYFFQFPDPFPTFQLPVPEAEGPSIKPGSPGKRVSFAEDVKLSSADATPPQDNPLAGLIGQLEIHESGAVRMRLANDIVFDVFAATQPSFLQQAVVLDNDQRTLHVLGGVTRRFVATPDIDALIKSAEAQQVEKAEEMELDQT